MKVLALGLLLGAMCMSGSAVAGDGWQGRPSACANITDKLRADRCRYWVQTVQRPDLPPGASCCGEADLYITDDFEVVDGALFMIVTADYPPAVFTDEEGNTIISPAKIDRGTRIFVPPEKMVTRPEDANQSPHGSVFIRTSDGVLLCATLPPLI